MCSMKYLRHIFEGSDSSEEVKDFAEGCLAYLLDDGFKVNVIDFTKSDKKMIFLSKESYRKTNILNKIYPKKIDNYQFKTNLTIKKI